MKAKAWCMIPYSKKDGIEIEMKPLVLCEDCKHWDNTSEGRYFGGWCFCEKLQFSTSPDWFCADGEERGEDE